MHLFKSICELQQDLEPPQRRERTIIKVKVSSVVQSAVVGISAFQWRMYSHMPSWILQKILSWQERSLLKCCRGAFGNKSIKLNPAEGAMHEKTQNTDATGSSTPKRPENVQERAVPASQRVGKSLLGSSFITEREGQLCFSGPIPKQPRSSRSSFHTCAMEEDFGLITALLKR